LILRTPTDYANKYFTLIWLTRRVWVFRREQTVEIKCRLRRSGKHGNSDGEKLIEKRKYLNYYYYLLMFAYYNIILISKMVPTKKKYSTFRVPTRSLHTLSNIFLV